MPDVIDLHLQKYAEHIRDLSVPSLPTRIRPERRALKPSPWAIAILLTIFSIGGGVALAQYLISVRPVETELARAFTAMNGQTTEVERYRKISRPAELREARATSVVNRLEAISNVEDISESVDGTDITIFGEIGGAGKYYMLLWSPRSPRETRAKSSGLLTFADTHGLPTRRTVGIQGSGYQGFLDDLGGLSKRDRTALAKAVAGTR